MTTLQYYAYPDHGARLREGNSYSQAVCRIECAGKGNNMPTTALEPPSPPLPFPLVPYSSPSNTWSTRP